MADAYVANRVNVTWFSRQPTRYNREIELPEYRIVSISGEYCDGTYSYAIMEHNEQRGAFSFGIFKQFGIGFGGFFRFSFPINYNSPTVGLIDLFICRTNHFLQFS
jgi:hypothetical protein